MVPMVHNSYQIFIFLDISISAIFASLAAEDDFALFAIHL